MALVLNAPSPIQVALTKVAQLRQEFSVLDAAYAAELAQNASLQRIADARKQSATDLSAAEDEVRRLAREGKISASHAGVKVTYSDPMKTTFDWRLLADNVKDFWSIPGIIDSVALNPEGLAAAVAAGILPEDLVKKATKEEPATRDGRVVLK